MDNLGRIATNTPAFEQYGLRLMLAEAESMRQKWGLDIPDPLAVSNVSFYLRAGPEGINGSIATKDGRFRWAFDRNRLQKFGDTNYYPYSFRYEDDECARLAKIKSAITAQEAAAIARDHLHRLGLTEKQLHLRQPPEVTQYKFEESDDTVYPLPIFHVEWHEKDMRQPSGDELDLTRTVNMYVSGITKQVVEYFNVNRHTPFTPVPTNYCDLLGVKPPTNSLQRIGLQPWPLK